MLRNYTEVAVAEMLPRVMEEYKRRNPDVCDCARCLEDIMAIALNRLPPRYVVTDAGTIYTNVIFDQIGGRAEVTAAILHGIKIVSAHPRH
ncbi:MAG: late competence development ComFB family protein [Firmicutes bacterium]|nr:late competence development ComFB family protein [Bacillota bacterium]